MLPETTYPKRTAEEIEKNWIVRHKELSNQENSQNSQSYLLIGDTSGNHPEYEGIIKDSHNFQIVKVHAFPGTGMKPQVHDYVAALFPMSGKWRIYWGTDQETIEGEMVIEEWDLISIPSDLWYGYENVGTEEGWMFVIQEPHGIGENQT